MLNNNNNASSNGILTNISYFVGGLIFVAFTVRIPSMNIYKHTYIHTYICTYIHAGMMKESKVIVNNFLSLTSWIFKLSCSMVWLLDYLSVRCVYVIIFVYGMVCVWSVCMWWAYTILVHTHMHTYIHIYIYIYKNKNIFKNKKYYIGLDRCYFCGISEFSLVSVLFDRSILYGIYTLYVKNIFCSCFNIFFKLNFFFSFSWTTWRCNHRPFDDPLPQKTLLSLTSSTCHVLLQLLVVPMLIYTCHILFLLMIAPIQTILYTTQVTLVDTSHRYYK